tara:strand:+ start:1371 stop:3074 length:1704 start_codon:yes stop_codon:yes gene_type:complete
MALQGDGNGIVTIPKAVATADYLIRFSAIQLTEVAGMILADNLDTKNFVYNNAGANIRTRMNGGDSTEYDGTAGEVIEYEVQKIGQNVTIKVNGILHSSPVNFGSVNFDTLFSYDSGTLKGTNKLSGTLYMEGFTSPDHATDTPIRSYDFSGSGTTLIDTVSGKNGTLSGFTTGGFVADPVSDTITISSVVNHESRQRNVNGQAVFTISGAITGTATAVEYRLDNGAWSVLDAAPTTSYSGSVTVTGEQDVSVRFSNSISVTTTVSKLKAAMCIVIAPAQSNAVSRVTSAQTLTIGAGKPTPSMFINGAFSELADPTGRDFDGTNNGSLWVKIAQYYSDLGVPVCIGNVAQGGTKAIQWAKGTTYYTRIVQFGVATGGIELAVSLIGESDSFQLTTKAQFKIDYLSVAQDINTDYGCDIYAVYFPYVDPQGVADIRSAYDELITENEFIKFGGDLGVMDISSATNPVNDDVHIKTDADALTASNIIWDAITQLNSIFNLVNTNTPDGVYSTDFYNDTQKTLIETKDLTFVGGSASITLNIEVGKSVLSLTKGSNPPTTGIAYLGVTE